MNLEKLTKMDDFSGRSVVVTGGTGIIGSEIVCTLVGCGASVAILNRDMVRAEKLIKFMGNRAGTAISVYCDVLKTESLAEAAKQVVKAFGRIDWLINAAGGNIPDATTDPENSFFDLSQNALQEVVDLNLMGTILPSQYFGKYMADQQAGIILNISSMNAFRPLTRIPAYSAAKAAINNFTQWLSVHMAQEYSPNIRVNAIAPGFFLTKQNRYLLINEKTGELTSRGKKIIEQTPMKRFGQPEDVLGTILWLLSPASKFVTGIVVPIDGGFAAFGGV